MIAYTYLRPGRVGQFADVRWPDPGAWLDRLAAWLRVALCLNRREE